MLMAVAVAVAVAVVVAVVVARAVARAVKWFSTFENATIVAPCFCHDGTIFSPWCHHIFTDDRFFFWAVSKNMVPLRWQKSLNGICDYSSDHHWYPTHYGAPPTRGRQKNPCKIFILLFWFW